MIFYPFIYLTKSLVYVAFQIVLSCLSLSTLALPAYAPQTYHVAHGYYHGPPAPLAHDGRVVDTPEVAHAKKAHFSAYAAEAAKTVHHPGYPVDGSYIGEQNAGYAAGGSYGGDYGGGKYHGPPAPLAHDGRVIDTPEVAHAKAAHLAAHAEELSKVAHLSYAQPYSHGPW